MKDITVTIFVEPNSLKALLIVLKIVENLDLEQNYRFDTSEIQYSESLISNWMHINLPIELYINFTYYYMKSQGK